MTWSRRNAVKLLSGVSATPVVRLLSLDWLRRQTLATAPAHPAPPISSWSGQRPGQTYKDITYKTFLIDFQFTDIDPDTMKRADAERLADQTAEMGAESLMVYAMTNTGFTLYKSQFAPKFKNLPDNFLGEFLDACHKRNIKTVLYYSLCWQRIEDLDHPDWAELNEQGKPKTSDTARYGFMGKINHLCLNTAFRDLALNQIREIAGRFTFDSWFTDIFDIFDMSGCYNPACLRAWKDRTGEDLPRPLTSEILPYYLDFKVDTHRSMYRAIKEQLKAATGRDVPITHNDQLDYADDTYVFHESNPRGVDYYETTVSAKTYRARARGRELQMCPHLNNNYLDYVNAPLTKLRWQMATITSHNASVMWGQQANVDGTVDVTTVRLVKEAYKVADRLIPKVKGTVPYAEVAVLSSERSELLTKGRGYDDFYAASKLLIDLHWPYDVVVANPLIADDLAPFQLLIIPGVEHLSANDRQLVLDYLEKGGNAFLCGRCATADEHGKPHADPNFGLVKIAQETHAPRGYIKPSFPIDDERLKAADIVTVEPDASHQIMGRLIRLSATRREGFPLEDVAYPLETTDQPVIVIGRKGKGQFVYAGYRFFQEYHEQNLPVIADVFRHLVDGFYKPAVWVEAPTVVDAIYNQLGRELRIALVNGITAKPSNAANPVSDRTEPSGYTNIVDVIPIANTRILLRERRVRRATDLAGNELRIENEGTNTAITLPHLDQYDLITVRLA